MSVIVADTNMPISGDEFIALSVNSILDDPGLSGLRYWLCKELSLSGQAAFPNSLDLCQAIVAILANKGASLGAHRASEIRNAITKVQLAVARIRDNVSAYSVEGRLRPQAVYWPDPTVPGGRSLQDELPYVRDHKIISRTTPVGSAGSCFAIEIANYLKNNGYNYVVTEPNKFSCANWGVIFNTISFRDLIQVAFGVRRRPRLLWKKPTRDNSVKLLDPFREDVEFNSIEEYEEGYDRHISNAREALMTAKVFILTLGMNEVWSLTSDGSALSRSPWRLAPHLTQRRVLSIAENVEALQTMFDVWSSFNPELQLIITVSPVPLHATFRGDEHHVIAANQHSKSTLRLAAEEFCNRQCGRATYFPSYEMVMNCIKDPWDQDQRHVTPAAVAKVMTLFEAMFVEG
jgi:hypothetical protein